MIRIVEIGQQRKFMDFLWASKRKLALKAVSIAVGDLPFAPTENTSYFAESRASSTNNNSLLQDHP